MRSSAIRFATASTKYLTPGNPTGLTGVFTHPSPRTELIALYSSTLAKLSKLPASSAYRNATEALTKHRLAQAESLKPAGWDEWKAKADALLQKYPNLFKVRSTGKTYVRYEAGDKVFISEQFIPEIDPDEDEFQVQRLPLLRDGHDDMTAVTNLAERSQKIEELERGEGEWIPEPKLDADQVSQLEDKIGGGLIEEVIEVAKGELKLVDTMLENKIWEELQDKPASGQWEYFQRDRNVPQTQEAPKV